MQEWKRLSFCAILSKTNNDEQHQAELPISSYRQTPSAELSSTWAPNAPKPLVNTPRSNTQKYPGFMPKIKELQSHTPYSPRPASNKLPYEFHQQSQPISKLPQGYTLNCKQQESSSPLRNDTKRYWHFREGDTSSQLSPVKLSPKPSNPLIESDKENHKNSYNCYSLSGRNKVCQDNQSYKQNYPSEQYREKQSHRHIYRKLQYPHNVQDPISMSIVGNRKSNKKFGELLSSKRCHTSRNNSIQDNSNQGSSLSQRAKPFLAVVKARAKKQAQIGSKQPILTTNKNKYHKPYINKQSKPYIGNHQKLQTNKHKQSVIETTNLSDKFKQKANQPKLCIDKAKNFMSGQQKHVIEPRKAKNKIQQQNVQADMSKHEFHDDSLHDLVNMSLESEQSHIELTMAAGLD